MSDAEDFCVRHKIPVPLLKEVWGTRHRIKGWQIDEAVEEYWADILAGRSPEPEDIDAGWNIMRRARAKRIRRIGQNMTKVDNLRSEVEILKKELEFARLPWYRKMNWRMYK